MHEHARGEGRSRLPSVQNVYLEARRSGPSTTHEIHREPAPRLFMRSRPKIASGTLFHRLRNNIRSQKGQRARPRQHNQTKQHQAENKPPHDSTLLPLLLLLLLLLLLSLLLLLLPPELLLGELPLLHVPQKREAVAALAPAKLADDSSRDERVPAVVADVGEVLRLAQEVRVGPSAVRPPHDPVGLVSRGRGMSMSPCCGLPRSFGDLFRLRAADHDGLAHGGGRAAMPSDDGCRHTHRLLGVLGGSHVGQEAHAEGCRGR